MAQLPVNALKALRPALQRNTVVAVEIFTGPNCGYCSAAKQLLTQHGLAFTEFDVSDVRVRDDFRARLPRTKSVPQIFIDGVHIGGYEDLKLHMQHKA